MTHQNHLWAVDSCTECRSADDHDGQVRVTSEGGDDSVLGLESGVSGARQDLS